MGEIFRYTDRDGDYLRVDARHPDRLRFRAGTDDGAHASDVDRHNVLALHAALGAWLYPTAPGTPDTTLLEQMVRKAAEDAVTAILPLHLSGARSQSVSIDPEPHDVGHAEEPVPEHHGRLMSELPRRARRESGPTWDDKLWGENTGGAPAVECTCTHRFSRGHGRLGCNASSCTCRWTGAGTQ